MSNSSKKIEGRVSVSYLDGDRVFSDGRLYENTACIAATKAMAAAYAGDTSLAPKNVAFLYSTEQKDLSINAATTWQEVLDSGYDTNIVGFSYRATVDDNTVTFHARTEGIPNNVNVYAACLLGKSVDSPDSYEVLAIVDLGEKKKPDDFELAIDWTVKFNYGAVDDSNQSEEEGWLS